MQADMPASVRDALDALSPVPAPDSDVWAANRVAFLDQARAFAREAALPPVSANAPIPWWRRLGESVALGKAFLLYDRGPVAVALKAVLVIAVALAASTGTVSAARGSLPGSLLYPLKVRLEAREMDRARTPDAIARTALAHADVRVEEATRLQRKGDPVPEETAVRYEQQLELALSAAGDLEEPVREQTQAEISESVHEQMQMLERTSAQVQGDAVSDDQTGSDPGIQAMIRTMRETQLRLRPTEAPGPGQPPPENPGHGPGAPVADDEGEQPGVGEPATTGDDAAPSGDRPGPGPGGVGDVPIDDGSTDDEPSEGVPDGEAPAETDGDDDDGPPGPGPGPSRRDDGDTRAPGPGRGGSSDGDADAPGVDTRGGNADSDNDTRSGRSGAADSGRS